MHMREDPVGELSCSGQSQRLPSGGSTPRTRRTRSTEAGQHRGKESDAALAARGGKSEFYRLLLSLPSGHSGIQAVLLLDAHSGAPLTLRLSTHSGGAREWSWRRWPCHAIHTQHTGQQEEYVADRDATTRAATEVQKYEYSDWRPPWRMAGGATPAAVDVEVARCDGGQFLLRGALQSSSTVSSKPGWFILDPCCETAAVSADVAKLLSLPAFGQMKVI